MIRSKDLLLLVIVCIGVVECRWSEYEANQWYSKYNWSAGFNYAPSYACNEIEMW
jgi:hypothetical protein